ncbi:hypothetical protein OOT46_29915 [Aquabacterium sp. A7-Y]|uniref:hypothetical protein n=1 Tax=Aquabacterium sp. A7-Y TaxID=1349605 RepID=UPI00223DEE32|nr:hypothetical protein [Aquabacterium sp. A7-Y]MCW7542018.1 hypothetical protein [Aquabacterium sp. A7-Y]
MSADVLIRKLRAQRESWVPVAEGKRVRIIRPPEAEMVRFIADKGMKVEVEHVRDYVTGWSGITEADLLGEAVGSSDEVPFDTELWAEVVADRLAWHKTIATELLRVIAEHRFSLQEAAKN